MSAGEANREVFLSRSLSQISYAAKSAAAGHITVSQLEVLAHAHSRHPEDFEADEPMLVETISGLTLADTRRATEYWSRAHDQGAGPEVEAEPGRVYLSKTWHGRSRLDGDLDVETHALLSAALDSLMTEQVRSTPREDLDDASVRRARALAELARRYLDAPGTPRDRGNRPHLTVVIDWDTLTGAHSGGLCELTDGIIISQQTARRLACDARVCRMLTGPEGEILDLGRSVRTATPAQWRALGVRDRECQFPGCGYSWHWCDAHHIESWLDGGLSDLCNLCLLCRHHHTLVHEGGWTLGGSPGAWTLTRPDGTVLANAPP